MSLERSVRDAVAKMDWLEDSDRAAVDLALTYARQIDVAVSEGEGVEVTKALYLGPHLLNALKALGGTPLERKEIGEVEEVGGKLARLRAVAGG